MLAALAHALAHLAVERNAAGAFLAPAGASLADAAIVIGFLGARLGGVALGAFACALAARELTRGRAHPAPSTEAGGS